MQLVSVLMFLCFLVPFLLFLLFFQLSHFGVWCACLGDMFTEEQNELVESAAEMLYGLIHVRYILTSKGMAAMVNIICYINLFCCLPTTPFI